MSLILSSFERAVLDAFLAGDDPVLAQLRTQATVCTVAGRKHTGVGAFTDLAVPGSVQRVSPPALTFGDVDINVPGVESGQTALLFVRDGAICLLEFATYAGEWPLNPSATRIGYLKYVPATSGGYSLLTTMQRDPETLAIQLAGQEGAGAASHLVANGGEG